MAYYVATYGVTSTYDHTVTDRRGGGRHMCSTSDSISIKKERISRFLAQQSDIYLITRNVHLLAISATLCVGSLNDGSYPESEL